MASRSLLRTCLLQANGAASAQLALRLGVVSRVSALRRMISTGEKGGPKKAMDIPPNNPSYGGSGDIFIMPGMKRRPPGPKTAEDFADVDSQKNWISYGFDMVYKKEDRRAMHVAFFSVVTIAFCGIGYLCWYYPDIKLDNWANREAFLEIHRRKQAGLPLIDKNYADPTNFELPSEEEIGDQEIFL